MDSKDLIKAGRLFEARNQLTDEVKSSPADLGKRTLLFQVLSYYGKWDQAQRHLDVIGAQDSSKQTGVQVYKNLIHAEKERMEVFNLERRPSFLPKTPSYIEMHFEAWSKISEKKIEEAKKIFDQIEAQRRVLSGTVNGKYFSGFKDTDSMLSFFIEAFVHDRYIWIPIEYIRELTISTPKTLFDLLWGTALITTWEEGLTINCYLPVLYPNSFLNTDDRIKLGRMTDWTPLGGPFSQGMGQHVYEIGEDETAILEIQEVLFKPFIENENE
ncbi:MAG: hypothetical protein JW786_11600 [Desulfobacterales bacterium]|nr:hypothetical protein [Desulfobacterales bacterium]